MTHASGLVGIELLQGCEQGPSNGLGRHAGVLQRHGTQGVFSGRSDASKFPHTSAVHDREAQRTRCQIDVGQHALVQGPEDIGDFGFLPAGRLEEEHCACSVSRCEIVQVNGGNVGITSALRGTSLKSACGAFASR